MLPDVSKLFLLQFVLDQTTLEKNFGPKFGFKKKVIFFFSAEIGFFWTNMESNAAVTLHFEDLAVQNNLLLKMCAFVGEKSQII